MAEHIILHPTDFSAHSQPAFEFACSLASLLGEKLVIVHVATPVEPSAAAAAGLGVGTYPTAGVPLTSAELAERNAALQKQLEATKPTNPNIEHEQLLLEGEPAEEIVKLAEQISAAQIVMGSHGRQGFSRLLMGSVAESVVRSAKCPVTIVKAHSSEEGAE